VKRPQPTEYAEYYSTYVERVPDADVLALLAEGPHALEGALFDVAPEDETFAYEAEKWTIREVLGHLIDTERLFSYRALHIARSDPAELPGMEQDEWTMISNAGGRTLADLLQEFRALREANVSLFRSFDPEILDRRGIASGVGFTVRALLYIIAGHEIHHRGVLIDRYVAGLGAGR